MLQFVQFTGRSQAQHPHFNPFDSNHLNLSHIFSNQPKFLPTARHVVKTNFDPRGPPPNKFKTLNKAADSFVFCFFFWGGGIFLFLALGILAHILRPAQCSRSVSNLAGRCLVAGTARCAGNVTFSWQAQNFVTWGRCCFHGLQWHS